MTPRGERPPLNILSIVSALTLLVSPASVRVEAQSAHAYEFNDSHFHLTNYIQNGTDIHDFLRIMGSRVGRVALFGIPLQQMWAYDNSGSYAPSYYLNTDAPLYYYSFTDAIIASAFKSLTPDEQRRFDPMITGFNPADMYATDHIRRVLLMFPGVFTGIGEFTIHKEFVSAKVAGEIASLTNPALDSILSFAGQAGLLVIIHNDIDVPFSKKGNEPVYLSDMKALLRRHPGTRIIWAHVGLGRVVHPVQASASEGSAERNSKQLVLVEQILSDPTLGHVSFDISWDELAKYIVATPETIQHSAALINRFPDRFLFGTDVVAPPGPEQYFAIFEQYAPLWNALTPEARDKVQRANYERLFNEARTKVRAWEASHAK